MIGSSERDSLGRVSVGWQPSINLASHGAAPYTKVIGTFLMGAKISWTWEGEGMYMWLIYLVICPSVCLILFLFSFPWPSMLPTPDGRKRDIDDDGTSKNDRDYNLHKGNRESSI